MVIKKINENIKVDFEDFTLEFAPSDENLNILKDIKEKIEEINKISDDASINEVKDKVGMWWKTLFDEETYKKVYEFSGKSSYYTAIYFVQTVKVISEGLTSLTEAERVAKYL